MKEKMSNFIRFLYCSLRGIPVLGIWGSTKFLIAALTSKQMKIRLKQVNQKLLVRGNTSDVETFYSIIIRSSYPVPNRDVKTIIDAGANVGYSAFFFADAYPNATVYALEPELSNYKILLKNTSRMSNIVPVNCALWSSSGELYLQNQTAESFSYQFGNNPKQSQKIISYSLKDLMSNFSIEQIDILKIDIEGAEKELFSGNTDWLNKVETIYIEIHDQQIEGVASQIFNVMSDYQYRFDIRFEYVVLDKIKKLDGIQHN